MMPESLAKAGGTGKSLLPRAKDPWQFKDPWQSRMWAKDPWQFKDPHPDRARTASIGLDPFPGRKPKKKVQ